MRFLKHLRDKDGLVTIHQDNDGSILVEIEGKVRVNYNTIAELCLALKDRFAKNEILEGLKGVKVGERWF